jgi:hypothetical protein
MLQLAVLLLHVEILHVRVSSAFHLGRLSAATNKNVAFLFCWKSWNPGRDLVVDQGLIFS